MSESSKSAHRKSAEHPRPAADKKARSGDLPSAAATPPAAESPAPETAETTNKLRTELEQAQDRILRLQAELENFRKRSARDLQEQLRYANMGVLRDLLPVLDNVRRAIDAAEKGSDDEALLNGFRLLAQQLEGVLARHDCEKIEALDAPFDPHLHEAISQQPSSDHPPHTVMMVTQDGYRLHDRVVRPSQVIVSSASKEP